MELASGSVYKAFKDKRTIFTAAFDREGAVRGEKLRRILNGAKTGRDRIREAIIFYAESSSGVEGKLGCLVVGSTAELSTFDTEVAQRVTAALDECETLMVDLIRQARPMVPYRPPLTARPQAAFCCACCKECALSVRPDGAAGK
jgi:TetR/AcrR family transcriptional repressor of nem operon